MNKHFFAIHLRSISKQTLVLFFIVLVGIFLRVYNFHDWLLFGPDQVRDAIVVNDSIEGKSGPILLGAQAGNSQFYLGPIYYQMQSLSVKLFGNSPEKFAYPDLLFSILSIPLLFFFLKKYFSPKISLFLCSLYAISYFSIYAARFAVNSNPLSFFVVLFLYGLLEMMEPKNKKTYVWAIIVGIALGVGIQLHALAFVAMPLVAIVACIFLIWKKNLTWKNFCLVVFFFLLMNFGQLVYETKNEQSNLKHFFTGAGSQTNDVSKHLIQNFSLTIFCQARANLNQISSLETSKYCTRDINITKTLADFKKTGAQLFIIKSLIAIMFMIGGFYFMIIDFRTAKLSADKKRFLGLLILLNFVFIILFIPVVYQTEVHYFNFIFVVSFVFLGLWLEKISRLSKFIKNIVPLVLLIFFITNIYSLAFDARKYATFTASDDERSILGEIIPLANFIVENSQDKKIVYLDGDRISSHRFSDALGYLVSKKGIELAKVREDGKTKINPGLPFFYVKLFNEKQKNQDIVAGRKIEKFSQVGNVMVYNLQNNSEL